MTPVEEGTRRNENRQGAMRTKRMDVALVLVVI